MGYREPGKCDDSVADGTPPRVPGAYYVGAAVDELHWVDELIESNNHTTGALIVFGTDLPSPQRGTERDQHRLLILGSTPVEFLRA